MPAQPCTNHPSEMTFVRCGRCDQPFCVRCLVDTPVGKKCRPCARNRTHLEESTPREVLIGFVAATVVAVPAGWMLHTIPMLFILAFPYGAIVAEVALRTGGRRRSTAMQIAVGVAALIGSLAGAMIFVAPGPGAPAMFVPLRAVAPYSLMLTAIGVAVAVSRVRFL